MELELDGREVRLSNPDKVSFAERGHTKLDLVEYYLEVADACLLYLRDRPTTMKRFPNGAGGEFFFQKRVPRGAPEWLAPRRGRRPRRRALAAPLQEAARRGQARAALAGRG